MTWCGVLFDLDGTLADTVELILKSFRHTMERHLGDVPEESRFLESIGRPLPIQLRDFARTEEERLAMLETYVAYQRTHHDEMVKPFPGALEVVDELRDRGVRVGVVTSKGHRIARRTLEVCDLHQRVELVVCGDEVECGKPHPEPVLKALAGLELLDARHRVLFVGDSPHDLRAGREAGTKTAAVGWGPLDHRVLKREAPDFFLQRMEDVLYVAP
jgi:pyrophosphatase PpaX